MYRLRRRDDDAVFGHSAGPQSWKRFLHPPRQRLWSVGPGGVFEAPAEDETPYAFVGVRGCDLAAIAVLRRVLCPDPDADSATARRFRHLFVVAAHCTEPGDVCFCASMRTGPAAGPGYDLALTERVDDGGHRFLVDVGTDLGRAVLAEVAHRAATVAEIQDSRRVVAAASDRMRRRMPGVDLRDLLHRARTADVWADVADRCLTCGNCTMVCPTCFCTTHRGRHRVDRRARRALAALVVVLRARLHPTARWDGAGIRGESLPAVDLAQARHLVRPVRQLRVCRLRTVHRLVPRRNRHHRRGGAARPIPSGGGSVTGAEPYLPRALATTAREDRGRLVELTRPARFAAGDIVFRENEPADRCWFLRTGSVVLTMAVPGRGTVSLETLHGGDVLGWSWLAARPRWQFTAQASAPTEATELDVVALHQAALVDPAFGYAVFRGISTVLIARLQSTRARLLDLYAGRREG